MTRLRVQVLLLPLLLLLATPRAFAQAAPPPDSFPYGDQPFFPLRDLNIAQYEPDLDWQRTSERERQVKSGFELWFGSVSATRIGIARRVQLNVAANDRIRFYYQQEQLGTEEISAGSERIELQVRVAGPLSLTASTHSRSREKGEVSSGFGTLLTSPDRRRYLSLLLQHDALAYDNKTAYEAKYRRAPFRLLGETNLERGQARFYGFADWQVESRLAFESPRGSGGVRERRRYTRRTEAKLEWSRTPDEIAGIQYRYSAQGDDRRHFAGYVDPEKDLIDYDFNRDYHRMDVYGERRLGPWRARAIAGWWAQHDRGEFAANPTFDYRYRRNQLLYGGRVYRNVLGSGVEVGAGYWGNLMTAAQTPGREEARYADKIDLVFGYRFQDSIRAEVLTSHELAADGFGGFSAKALLLF